MIINQIENFYSAPTQFQTITTSRGKNLTLSKIPLTELGLKVDSVLISQSLPSQKILELIKDLLELDSFQETHKLAPHAHQWKITHSTKAQVTQLIHNELSKISIRSLTKERIIYCLEELISNAIYAQSPHLKATAGGPEFERPVDIVFEDGPEVKFLIIKDQYGLINDESKSKILEKIMKDRISPQFDRSCGGAGIGLNLVRDFCDFLVFRQKNQEWTEVCCIFLKNRSENTPVLFLEA